MLYCINPTCLNRHNPDDASHCLTCGASLLVHNRYCLLKRLHESMVKEIFEVEDVVSDDIKILKIIKAFKNTPHLDKHIELMQREARTLIGLETTNIPQVPLDGYFTLAPAEGSPLLHCLVMEKIEGQDLQAYVEQQGAISPNVALKWLKQLVKILEKIHQRELIHRDIKPSNVVRRPDGTLALIDFDAVRDITETVLSENDVTSILTPDYAAPEQFRHRAYPESDLYALGRTFIYLLTGKRPLFFDDNVDKISWHEAVLKRYGAAKVSEKLTVHQVRKLLRLLDRLMADNHQHRPREPEILKQIQRIEWSNKIRRSVARGSIAAGLILLGVGAGLGVPRWSNTPISEVVSQNASAKTCRLDTADVTDMNFARNGRYLATVSSDRSLRIWNMQAESVEITEESCIEYLAHADSAIAVQFTPNGRQVATASLDGTVKLWDFDTETGQVGQYTELNHEGTPVVAMAFSPNGAYLATGDSNGQTIIWDLRESTPPFEKIHEIRSDSGQYITSLSFSSDGAQLAVVSLNSRPTIWSTDGEEERFTLPHENVSSALFSPSNSQELATIGTDGTVKVWDVTTPEAPDAEIALEQLWIDSIQFNPRDGETIAIKAIEGGPNGDEVEVWMWNWREASEADTRFSEIVDVKFNPAGGRELGLIREGQRAQVLTTSGFRSVAEKPIDGQPIKLAFNPEDTSQLAIAQSNGIIQTIFWDSDD